MAGGLTISVRQIASYPVATISPADLILVQQGGQGGPYASAGIYSAIREAVAAGGPLAVGAAAPANAWAGGLFCFQTVYPNSGGELFNAYFDTTAPSGAVLRYLGNGVAGQALWESGTYLWQIIPSGVAGAATPNAVNQMVLDAAGSLLLPSGTLKVARDPASAFEVATMGWVGASTVASFNNRKGVVTLQAADIYGALGICPPDCIATTSSVDAAICAAINDLLRTYPSVWSWMGRVGDVFLTVADMNFALAGNPAFQPPLMLPTPPQPGASPPPDPTTVVNIAWVEAYVAGVLAGPPAYATQDWVLSQLQSYAAVTSFNARTGAVVLLLADITAAGGAPLNGPNFSGIPTAPTAAVGTNSGQIATTAFVEAAISAGTAGVSSFNTRTGAVTLSLADITGAGGAPLTSPSFGGTPAAPTASPGTSTTQIATTQFVHDAIAAAAGVSSFNGRSGAVVLTTADITGAGGAPQASPNLTGTPSAPTATAGTATTQIATTAFVQAAIAAAAPGVNSFNGRTGTVTLIGNDISAAGGALLASPAFTGTPTAPTPSAGNNSTQIATTAFVDNAIATGAVTSVNGRSGGVTIIGADITGAGGALLNSPAFTGLPTGPTAAANTSTTQLATTAFVMNAVNALPVPGVTSFNTRTGAVTLTAADVTNVGGALLASPTFTGTPSGPTASPGTSSTQLATTAFVAAAIAALPATGVTSWNSRTGAVTLQANDLSAVGGALLASPVFTGTPTGPTAAPGTSTTQLATTAFVMSAIGGAGGVLSFNGRTGAVTLVAGDITNVGGALLASPAFTGSPTAPTAATADSSTLIATTAFVKAAIAANPGVTSFNTRTGAVTLTATDVNNAGGPYATTAQLAGYLPLTGGTLTGPGNLQVNGTLGVTGAASFTSINASGSVIANGFQVASTILFNTGAVQTGGNLTVNGSATIASNAQVNGTLTSINNFTCNQSGTIAGNLSVGQGGGGGGLISANGGAAALTLFDQANSGANVSVRYISGQYRWASNALSEMARMDPTTGNFVIPGFGYRPGGGPWSDSSDPRVKKIEGNYTPSLAAILQLQPVNYTFLGNDTMEAPPPGESAPYRESGHYLSAINQTPFVGLDASAVEAVFPECVTKQAWFIDGAAVSDMRVLDTGPLIFALINAVKELSERVAALDGKAAT